MIWLIDLWWHFNEHHKLIKKERQNAMEQRLDALLEKRKAARIIEQQRAKQAYWTAKRKAWANDPLKECV